MKSGKNSVWVKFRFSYILIGLLFLVNVVLLAVFLHINIAKSRASTSGNFPEISQLVGRNMTFKELEDFFTDVANEKGAEYAFSMLKVAPVPPNTDLHLLGHVIGDVLYKQQGASGIKVCTEDFRNACSHSIVVGLFTQEGDGALPVIADACREAPGGRGAYTMCFHGLGHGILAALGYDMEKAAEICQKTGTQQYNFQESAECVSGTVMEIVGGGGHDREIWEKQRVKYLSEADPLSPCKRDFIPENAKTVCYVYLTPHFFLLAGADLGSPTSQDFEEAFPYCDLLPRDDFRDRDACYGGFGKEFIGFASGREIARGTMMTEEQHRKVYDWCLLAKNDRGIQSCIGHAVGSLYWGGENDKSLATGFCDVIPESDLQGFCFGQLFGVVAYYVSDTSYRKDLCNEISLEYQDRCRAMLL